MGPAERSSEWRIGQSQLCYDHSVLFTLAYSVQATAAKYHQRMEHERKAREDAAKSIVMGLGDGLDSFDSDVLAGIADGIESVLRAPMGEGDESS